MGIRTIMVIRIFLLAALFTITLASCSKKLTTTTTVVKDSIIVKEVPRMVEVFVPGATVTVKEYIECDSLTNKPKPKKIQAQTGKAFTSVEVKADGTLTAIGGCDSLQHLVQVLDKEVFRLRYEKKDSVLTKIEYRTRCIDKFCRWFTGISIASCLLFLGLHLKSIL
jgi:hypothetical protein